ncbi:TPA: prepilin-type N-terminal cleavage/methylation domain-containing protein [Escherichia coli]|uniref:prepilin-type N-terminal cleavage/methylation domain-containing protein n=1 Tax=Escherichia coli TaxID=562 RepID=UPI0019D31F6D|nr:prepilin-type N-terminal cleavage/methylation domain-containing protein [Escherichia coli]HDC4575036.1 prepilin-type N-terminal cleavage/methylation domain-containing protein [Shigella sonnei]MBN6656284.1 prepilin-type N-terminal cleavage/methylation domain-containing protein [Escherichia coli]HBB4123589.1 prepilin-type N-terminal cleavage/methylation domain-containing protein [Escherichia coli]HBB9530840.1 prepilin-type N-terminal cleavage/methylation domain-containing protein [Escherichia 
MKYKNLTVSQKGLSLIESAMVLAISAVVVSGVLYYYNQAQENRKLEEGIKQIQTIAASVNKLYTNSTTSPRGDNNGVVEAISAITGIPTKMGPNNVKMFSTPSGQWVEFWANNDGPGNNAYTLETQVQSVSSCISYATLNMGTIMAAKTKVLIGSNDYVNNGASNNSTNFSLSPSVASAACEKAGNAKGNDNNIKIRYTLRY